MRLRLLARLALLLLLGSPVFGFAQGEQVIDEIVVTVNNAPVLLSEWQDALRYEAFLEGRPTTSFSEAERNETLQRLIDRELISQQMQGDFTPNESDVAEQVKKVRAQLQGAETDQGWQQLLKCYDVSNDDLVREPKKQVELLRFIELRLRPSVRVTQEDIQEYYRDKLVPELQRKGITPEPLEKLRPRIREVLVQERMQPVLDAWVANLRNQSVIHYTAVKSAVPTGTVQNQ